MARNRKLFGVRVWSRLEEEKFEIYSEHFHSLCSERSNMVRMFLWCVCSLFYERHSGLLDAEFPSITFIWYQPRSLGRRSSLAALFSCFFSLQCKHLVLDHLYLLPGQNKASIQYNGIVSNTLNQIWISLYDFHCFNIRNYSSSSGRRHCQSWRIKMCRRWLAVLETGEDIRKDLSEILREASEYWVQSIFPVVLWGSD